MNNALIRICFILLCMLSVHPAAANAGDQQSILVLDASGSMWGQIEGKAKITIARDVIAGMLKAWPADQQIGLMAYGHRRKADCSDIEMLIPVGVLNATRFNKAVKTINPKGKTPLTEAVKQAADALKYTEDKATVILVSDGKETCAADPCAVSAMLEKTGVDFTTHVIGFDVAEKEGIKQLQCLAGNTGGEYLTAKNAAGLQKALATAVEKVAETAKPDPKAPVNLHLAAVLTEGGKPVGGNWFTVYREESDEFGKAKRIKVDSDGYMAETTFRLKPGDYVVTAALGKAVAEQSITIQPAKAHSVVLNLNAGYLRVNALLHEGGKKVGGNWFSVYREQTDEFGKAKRVKVDSNGYKAETTFTLPAGEYVVTASLDKAYAEAPVTVVAGKGVEQVLNLNAGRLRVQAVLAAGEKKVGGNWFYVYREKTDEFGKIKRKRVASDGYKSETTFTLPAGDYIVTASKGKMGGESRATVVAAKGVEAELIIALHAPDYVKRLGDGKWQAWSSSQGDMGLLEMDGGKTIGFYNQRDAGRLLLQRDGNVMTGFWIENKSKMACDSERDGSRYWGRVHWQFDDAGNSFKGWWSYCEADSGEVWTGKR